ncbi:MAG TPA: type II secretion system F family protein [Bryobacteraceae bacterium]|nr:type II secretion system F family protein [Bryobacteraceae bacterium]
MLILSMLSFFAVIFLLAAITVAIAWMGFVKRTEEQSQAAREEAGEAGAAPIDAQFLDDESPLFRTERLSSMNFWDNLLARFDFVEILKRRIAEADLDWSVGRVTLIMLLCGTVSMLTLQKVLPAPVGLAGAVAAAFAPYAVILRIRDRRFRKFLEAFPDTLDSLARALRAGYALAAAMDLVASEAPAPVGPELKRTSAEANLGMGWPRALENLGRRVPVLEVNLFGAAVLLHSRTGGKLGEVISALAESMRESMALHGEVRALAAHGKLTGAILTVLPIAIAGIMFFVNPDYMMVLLNHPWGKDLIAGAVGCLVLAHFVIRKLVDIHL